MLLLLQCEVHAVYNSLKILVKEAFFLDWLYGRDEEQMLDYLFSLFFFWSVNDLVKFTLKMFNFDPSEL